MSKSIPPKLRTVITGAGSGLGRAFCLELAPTGARIVVSDINRDGAEETAELIRQNGGEALVVEADVAQWESMEALQAKASEWLGHTDLLINNAGVAVRGDVETTSLEDWDWIMGINVWGVIHGCRAFLPGIKEQGQGYIINVASAAGLMSTPRLGAYNLTKAAVVSLSETLYSELAHTDINVSVLCPTFFKTNIIESGRGAHSGKAKKLITQAMERSKIQAPDVAKFALNKVVNGQLYALPMQDATWFWRLKRLSPSFFHGKFAAPKRRA